MNPTTAITSLSCASSSFCMAGDLNGNTYAYDGASWSLASSPDGSTVTGISCTPTPASCMAVTENGNALITSNDGQSWTFTPQPDGAQLDAVSCVSATTCVVTDDTGNAFILLGGTWIDSPPVSPYPLTSVSCASATFCAALDSQGNVFTYQGSLWTPSSQNPIFTASGGSALTCLSGSLCLMGDASGNVYAYDNGIWTPDHANPVDSDGGVTAISCTSTSSCVVADSIGHALAYAPPFAPRAPIVLLPQSTLDVTTVSGTVGVPLTLETSGDRVTEGPPIRSPPRDRPCALCRRLTFSLPTPPDRARSSRRRRAMERSRRGVPTTWALSRDLRC